MNKVSPGNKYALINTYLQLPSPAVVIPWSEIKKQKLQDFHKNDIDMKETAVAILTKQIASRVYNNVKLLNTPEKNRLIRSLQDELQCEEI